MTKEALRLALEALENASNAIESWGSYASEYFQEKHDLQVDINNTQQAITAIKAALEAKDGCQCPACKVVPHASDCAVHSEPAHPTGECNCGAKDEPVAIHCKEKRKNNGVCPNYNLQCGWPKCNEPQTPVRVISSEQLSAMFQDLKGIDTSQSGYHWRVGYNAALRQAMDYSMPSYTTPPPVAEPHKRPSRSDITWVGLTDEDRFELAKAQHGWEDLCLAVEAKLKQKNEQ